MPDFMVPASANQSGGMVSRKPKTAGGPWEITQQQDIGAGLGNPSGHASMDNDRTTTAKSADPRCECVPPFDPRTEVR